MTKPYYERDGIVIYHGDCRDILPSLAFDVVVTDPPYGIGFQYATHNDTLSGWCDLINDVMPTIRNARFAVMPSCAIDRLEWWYANHKPEWLLAWHKGSPGHAAKVGFNDWEPHVAWGRPSVPMHDFWSTRCGFDANGHPCPKPIEWALWLVQRAASEAETVADPFMGSGTTLVAARELGRRAIGIEIEERYCEIAAKRLDQQLLPFECEVPKLKE